MTSQGCGLLAALALAGCLQDETPRIGGAAGGRGDAVAEGTGAATAGAGGAATAAAAGMTDLGGGASAGESDEARWGACDGGEPLPPSIESDLTIGPGCVSMDDFEVNGSATLTILPGTRIEFAPGAFLSVGRYASGGGQNGGSPSIWAVGTPEAPITFTSQNPMPRAGDWQCIHLEGDGSELDHVILEFGGAACGATGAGREGMLQIYGSPRGVTNTTIRDSSTVGVQLAGTPALFENNTFERNAQAPIRVSANSLTSIGTPNVYAAEDVIRVEPELVTRDGTWANQGVPYRLSAGFGVRGAITVAAGVRVEMSDGSLDVGTFNVLGTGAQPVVFTSAQASPAPGDWGCIFSAAALRIENAVFEYAGSGQSCSGRGDRVAVSAASGTTITDSVFRNIAGAAIRSECGDDLGGWCANTFEGLAADPLICGQEPTPCPGSESDAGE